MLALTDNQSGDASCRDLPRRARPQWLAMLAARLPNRTSDAELEQAIDATNRETLGRPQHAAQTTEADEEPDTAIFRAHETNVAIGNLAACESIGDGHYYADPVQL